MTNEHISKNLPDSDKTVARELIEEAVKNQPAEKPGCRFGCLRGCVVFFILAALPLYWFGCHSTSLRVARETTHVLGPMTSDGKRVDYFLAMEERFYPPEMKTDENGYRLIVRALGDPVKTVRDPRQRITRTTQDADPEPFHSQVYEKLGLDPDVAPIFSLGIQDWGVNHYIDHRIGQLGLSDEERIRLSGELYQLFGKPWKPEEYPLMQDWINQAGPAIDLISQAVRKPVFRMPWVRIDENTPIHEAALLLGETQALREMARTLACRAYLRIGTGDLDGALDDITAIRSLGRHAGKQGTLVSALVGVAIEGTALSIGPGENPEAVPTKEQLERFQRQIQDLPPRTTLEETLELERYFSLAALQDIYWGNAPSVPGGPLPTRFMPFMKRTVDINLFMARANRFFDSLIDGSFDERSLVRRPNPLAMLSIRSRSVMIMDTLSALMIPSVRAGREAFHRIRCQENLHRLTLALLLYEKERGQMPPGDWREAIRPRLGEDAGRYFQCPSCSLPDKNVSTYAMVRDSSGAVPQSSETPLLVELLTPMPFSEGDGSIAQGEAMRWMPQRAPAGTDPIKGVGSMHPNGMNASYRSGAVQFLSGRAAGP